MDKKCTKHGVIIIVLQCSHKKFVLRYTDSLDFGTFDFTNTVTFQLSDVFLIFYSKLKKRPPNQKGNPVYDILIAFMSDQQNCKC